MESVLIKSTARSVEDRDWVIVRTTFDCNLLEDPIGEILDYSVSLKEFVLKPNMGFVPYKHQNKDFILIPLKGQLTQKNSFGKNYHVKANDVLIMSSGRGIKHYEYNRSASEDLECLVFEIIPRSLNTKPYCETFENIRIANELVKIRPDSGKKVQEFIFEEVETYIGEFDKKKMIQHRLSCANRVAIVYVVTGNAYYNKTLLSSKDTIVVWNRKSFVLLLEEESKVIIFEVPKSLC